jgi:TadE-like protein
MVEFALVAPVALILLMSVVIIGIVVTNYLQLTNIAREGARVAAICGSATAASGTTGTVPLPDGAGSCTDPNIDAYIASHLVTIPGVNPSIYVCTDVDISQGNCSSTSQKNGARFCQAGALVEVQMSYDQPLYLPIVSNLLETKPNGTRTLTAKAQATCEQ